MLDVCDGAGLFQPRRRAVRLIRWTFVSMIVLLAPSTGSCSSLVIEDWSGIPTGTTGVPSGWHEQGAPAGGDMTVVAEGDIRALHLVSRKNKWFIAKDLRNTPKDLKSGVDVNQTPILEWSWKVTALPSSGDSRQDATSDYAAALCVSWLRLPYMIGPLHMCYLWDTVAPVGTIVTSKEYVNLRLIVVRSGTADLGTWVHEERDILDDFRRVHGTSPDVVGAIRIGISSARTRSTAEAWLGTIAFHGRTRP